MAMVQRSFDFFLDFDTPHKRAIASSQPVGGTPKASIRAAANDAPAESRGRIATGPLVLVVDDDPEHCAYMAEVLTRRGCQVGLALNGRDAIRRLEEKTFAAIVTDVYMPDFDGIELVRVVRERWPTLHVVAVTGGGPAIPSGIPNFLKYLGVSAILSKPFEPRDLAQAVENATRGSAD